MPQMDSPSPTRFWLVPSNPYASSLSSDTEVDVNHRNAQNASMAWGEGNVFCFLSVVLIWLTGSFFTWIIITGGVYGSENVWIGPSSSILIQPNPFFIQSVKVNVLDDSRSGLELYGFYRSPPLDVIVNWSSSHLVSVSRTFVKRWPPYYLNEGASLNISYSVKPEGLSVVLAVVEGMASNWLSENPADNSPAPLRNIIRGNGMIEVEISEASNYYVFVANCHKEDIKVELDIDVKAVLYDTTQAFYKCTFINGECTFKTTSLAGNSIVLTSPVPKQGASTEEDQWYISFTYQPRWIAYISSTVLVICFTLAAIQLWKRLQCFFRERYDTQSSLRTNLLAHKDDDDDGASMCSSNDTYAAEDADLEGLMDNENGERLCAICFDSPRDCFILPCGHCVSCYQCGTKIAEASGSCPICRRNIKKVKRIFTV